MEMNYSVYLLKSCNVPVSMPKTGIFGEGLCNDLKTSPKRLCYSILHSQSNDTVLEAFDDNLPLITLVHRDFGRQILNMKELAAFLSKTYK